MIPNVKVVGDPTAQTGAITGAYMNKGTGTDAVFILNMTTGATGTTTVTIQGNNTGTGAGTTVVPDKTNAGGAALLAGGTASAGVYVFHLAQLQFQFYRLVAAGGSTGVGSTVGEFFQLQDSFDDSVA